MKKKTLIFFVAVAMMITSACSEPKVYVKSSSECNEEGESVPVVTVQSSAGLMSAEGTYSISANGYGVLCSGRCFDDKEGAVANPIEIDSAGYEISVALSGREGSIAMMAGDAKLISCKLNGGGYIYVIIE